ncbi:uncharacterized protein L201_006085 [Kwoniella dendrophila CBS 6074]|uniref:THO complex subunit 7 n=1 Tax=Kwoniella dendrophila CBS 6074 TaxID=1295534 RepID=A0AAX4K1U1_9TREE
MSTAPFKEDALNRFRITHSDRDLKPLIRRLNRLSVLSSTVNDNNNDDVEVEMERELVKMELLKWKLSIERILGSINNLNKQSEIYKKQTIDTVTRTEQLRAALVREKEELENKRKLREHQVKCDEIAKRILVRGKTRKELDEQISNLTESLKDHQNSHSLYIEISQSRLNTFNEITRLINECKSLKLPIEPTSTLDDIIPQQQNQQNNEKMDIDPLITVSSSSSSSKLNLSALEFQPSIPSGASPMIKTDSTSSTSNKKAAATSNRASAPPQQPTNTNNLKPPSSGHLLPSRPTKSNSSNSTTTTGSSKLKRQGSSGPTLPNRPTNLRSSTTPASLHGPGPHTGGSLEDGEVGPEEGEVNVNEDSKKRPRGNNDNNSNSNTSRNTRSRNK